jgi:hypothetical protein
VHGLVWTVPRREWTLQVKANFRVRNCRICHLKSLDPLGLLVVFFSRRYPSLQFNHGGIGMNNKLLSCLIVGALSTTLTLAPPALAFHGGGGGGGMHGGGGGGGMHGGGGGGGMHGGMGGGMHAGGMGGGMHFGGMGGGARFGAMGGGMHFNGGRFAGTHFAHAGFSPRFSRFAFRDHRFFHHRFHRFAFIGAPYAYAAYDSCWSRAWTPYGLQWVNVCGDYGY